MPKKKKSHHAKQTKKPKGWVDNPKNLYDIVSSLESLGFVCDYRHHGLSKKELKKISI